MHTATTKTMPETIAILAQRNDIVTKEALHPSCCSIDRLIAAAAKPNGQISVGQVSPMRKESDFQRKERKGTVTAVDSRMATVSPRRNARHTVNATPVSTTGSRTKPTRPNCSPMNSPKVRSDQLCSDVADAARTAWKRNEAQSCCAFQITTGRNSNSAITAAAYG